MRMGMAGGEGESTTSMIERPVLTFPREVGSMVKEVYAGANSILEYGSGGSTVVAAEFKNKSIYSVESDKKWADDLQGFLKRSDAVLSMPVIHHVDVGPTIKWGHPAGTSLHKRFHLYPLEIWDVDDFVHPDTVLIDGRFRVGCFFACLLRCTKPMQILFDDYTPRAHYHVVERITRPVSTLERMAIFEVEPDMIPRSEFTQVIGSFSDPS
jgi:hypothetical protein